MLTTIPPTLMWSLNLFNIYLHTADFEAAFTSSKKFLQTPEIKSAQVKKSEEIHFFYVKKRIGRVFLGMNLISKSKHHKTEVKRC